MKDFNDKVLTPSEYLKLKQEKKRKKHGNKKGRN
jgi:hypothetical protein